MVTIQFVSLFIFICTLNCWIIPKKLDLGDNTAFVGMIIFTGVSILFDLLSTYYSYSYILDYAVKVLLRKIFLFSLVISFYFEFLYIFGKVLPIKAKELFNQYSIIAPIINVILVFILPLDIEIIQNGLNKGLLITGSSFKIAYVCAFIYLVGIILILIFYGKNMNKWYRIAFIISVVLWTISTVLKIFSTITGGVSIAISLSLLVVFAIVENPINKYNHKYHCFKNNEISLFLDRLCQLKDSNFVIYLDIKDLDKTNITKDRTEAIKKRIVNSLNRYRDTTIFITEEEEIIIVCNNIDVYDTYKTILKNEIESFYNSYTYKKFFKAITLSFENVVLFDRGEELLNCLAIKKEKAEKIHGHIVSLEIDEDEVIALKTEDKVKEDIMNAINEDRVEAFVQPVYSVKDNKIVSAEALCRIRKEDGTFMLPYQFIPISEKCGLDIAIGCRMTEKVCAIFANPATKNLFESIDINLSVAHCEEANMANKIISIAQKYGINPNKLNYEITESGFINKMANIEKNIKSLTDYGFGFSLDDFGKGESNLNYLVRFPVDYIKLDMHMVWSYFENDRAKKIIQTIIKISHDNNLKVIAEGVETKEQLDELVKEGVDYIQGYYFYKPMPVNDYLAIVGH